MNITPELLTRLGATNRADWFAWKPFNGLMLMFHPLELRDAPAWKMSAGVWGDHSTTVRTVAGLLEYVHTLGREFGEKERAAALRVLLELPDV